MLREMKFGQKIEGDLDLVSEEIQTKLYFTLQFCSFLLNQSPFVAKIVKKVLLVQYSSRLALAYHQSTSPNQTLFIAIDSKAKVNKNQTLFTIHSTWNVPKKSTFPAFKTAYIQ
jgi:hypothetical protein